MKPQTIALVIGAAAVAYVAYRHFAKPAAPPAKTPQVSSGGVTVTTTPRTTTSWSY